ncbi:MAG: hypothetical protein AAGF97_08160 [Planctomycetota bacterium]
MVALAVSPAALSFGQSSIPQVNDIVFGLSNPDGLVNLELVRNGAAVPDHWNQEWVASLAFDNSGGVISNVNGNLLGVDFGASGGTGNIYSLSTSDDTVAMGQLIGDTAGLGGGGLTFTTRLAGLSVSPNNDKIAVQGYDPGNVIVYDYTAGDTAGANAGLSGARETAPFLTPTDTQGTAWLDNNTIAVMDSLGSLYTVDATTMVSTFQAFIPTPAVGGDYSSILYNPDVSSMLYAAYSGFDGNASSSELYVIDPSNFNIVNTVDLSTSGESIREMAFDTSGNLYYGTFGGDIEVIMGAAADPANIADNSGLDFYSTGEFPFFPGLAIGLGDAPPPVADCDFNGDEMCDINDMDELTGAITAGNPDVMTYDLNGDGMVDGLDVDEWRAQAGAMNLLSGNPYLVGDANLDGTVDGQDFISWNSNKFTNSGVWSQGDFNVDGVTDGQDFVAWNSNKFTSADGAVVPEPSYGVLSLLIAALLAGLRRRR